MESPVIRLQNIKRLLLKVQNQIFTLDDSSPLYRVFAINETADALIKAQQDLETLVNIYMQLYYYDLNECGHQINWSYIFQRKC